MRTITLELLRHGPANNQLLSPLTPYLALCENHAAVTLHVPFEHNQFLFRLKSLRYENGEHSRLFHLNDTAKSLGDLLGQIPGLTAESSKVDGTAEQLTHLRLIVSASELALLPFELALSPNGMPGTGQHLLLQPQMPVCMTREIRRVPGEHLQWPKRPRILFAAAAPPKDDRGGRGVGQIPLESHLQALRKVITPWVKYFDEADPDMRRKRVEEHLYFLPQASIEAIQAACATGQFTHVHILAHGIQREENFDKRFFLALHNSMKPDEWDLISGARLATALRVAQSPDSRRLSRPAVVTLASCDSGNVGSVAGAGSSIAHALHEAGIPMVIAGQFPLSFEGSVRLVECLYEGLLWGTDPRRLLYDLRRRLYTQFRATHDWASLTAYVSLPPDFDNQLPNIQIDQIMRNINVAMNHADEVTRRIFATQIRSKRSKKQQTDAEQLALLQNTRQAIREAKRRLERLQESMPEKKSRICGLLASTEKRQAEVIYSSTRSGQVDPNALNESIELLRQARDHYWESFLLDRSSSWAVVQYLSLTLMLKHLKAPNGGHVGNEDSSVPSQDVGDVSQSVGENAAAPDVASPQDATDVTFPIDCTEEKDLDGLWSLAHQLSLYDLYGKDTEKTIWALGNLLELDLLSLMMGKAGDRPDAEEAAKRVLDYAMRLIETAGRDSFEVYSTRRQMFRYLEWYGQLSNVEPVKRLAQRVFERFPEEAEEKWK